MQSVLLGTATWDLKQDLQFLNLSTKTILDLSKNFICMSVVISCLNVLNCNIEVNIYKSTHYFV